MSLRLLIATMALAPALLAGLTPEQLARVDRLEHAMLAPCCYSETVADHRSEVALEMQREIRQMVAAGATDREILDHYKEQYGMRILIEPEGRLWWLMNVVPVVLLVFGLAAVVLLLRKWRRPVPSGTSP